MDSTHHVLYSLICSDQSRGGLRGVGHSLCIVSLQSIRSNFLVKVKCYWKSTCGYQKFIFLENGGVEIYDHEYLFCYLVLLT